MKSSFLYSLDCTSATGAAKSGSESIERLGCPAPGAEKSDSESIEILDCLVWRSLKCMSGASMSVRTAARYQFIHTSVAAFPGTVVQTRMLPLI
jgi:hypothetical protein